MVDLLNSYIASIANYALLVDDYRNLMNQIPKWKLKHCFKEANACADQLARIAIHLQQSFIILDTPPVELFLLFYMTLPVLDVIDYVLILALRLCSSASVIYSLLPKKKKKTHFRCYILILFSVSAFCFEKF